jgi:hypothetical protein
MPMGTHYLESGSRALMAVIRLENRADHQDG